jgi:hypothetical protein
VNATTVALTRAPRSRPAIVLMVLFGATAWLLANLVPTTDGPPRWPADGELYAADGWTVSPASVDDSRPGMTIISHAYARAAGTRATLVVSTSPMAKAIYRAGAAVPFLGNGYTVEPAPGTLVAVAGNREAFIARRLNETWLQVSIYGERRGQFGSGALAWTLSTLDALLGRPNDYYLARIVVPFDGNDLTAARQAVALADTIFPRLATYYAN